MTGVRLVAPRVRAEIVPVGVGVDDFTGGSRIFPR